MCHTAPAGGYGRKRWPPRPRPWKQRPTHDSVLERGLAGDLLDLQVALAPCVVGYGESGERLLADPSTRRTGNPYDEWIKAYTSEDYRRLVREAIARLDRLGEEHGAAARYPQLLATFIGATRLEKAFWDMGWRAGQS